VKKFSYEKVCINSRCCKVVSSARPFLSPRIIPYSVRTIPRRRLSSLPAARSSSKKRAKFPAPRLRFASGVPNNKALILTFDSACDKWRYSFA